MHLYEIALPVWTNTRRKNYETQRKQWEAFALERAGGYTALAQAMGAWHDTDTKRDYIEPMLLYRVVCSSETWDALVRRAFELFDDQLALYTAQIGDAFIINRPSAVA